MIKKCKNCGLEAHSVDDLVLFCKDKNHPHGHRHLCRECKKLQQKKWQEKNPEGLRERSLRNRYGITLKDYDNMYLNQDGRCKICDEEKKLVIDHNHDTGKVRGLICHNCNRGIGFLMDNPMNLQRGYKYLMENGYYGNSKQSK